MARMMAASMINTDFIRKHPAQAVRRLGGVTVFPHVDRSYCALGGVALASAGVWY